MSDPTKINLQSTGDHGLDEILRGGLPSNRFYVIEGEPGSGKTTMALQFLLEGVRAKQKALYITFSETTSELKAVADSHGWDLSGLEVIDLSNFERQMQADRSNTLFQPSEIELNVITKIIVSRIEEYKPNRVVFDSVSEMRLLADNSLKYRRQILLLKQKLASLDLTAIMLDDLTHGSNDLQVQSVAHGVIRLSRLHHGFGGERRQIRVLKLRGVNFIGGHHDCAILKGGVKVYPRMISADHEDREVTGSVSSGFQSFDKLVGGGLDRGTVNLFIGPPGTGKSILCMVHALVLAGRGETVSYFCFDETIPNLLKRSRAIGLDVASAVNAGTLILQKVDPAEVSPGEFAIKIRDHVRAGARAVVIDSLNGYIQAMPQEQYLILQLHELFAYLNGQGIVTILTLAQRGLLGDMESPVDLTYLADTVILLRYFELKGHIKKAISVVKKRTGSHESTIREIEIGPTGVKVGEPLDRFQGIFSGIPIVSNDPGHLTSN